MTGDISSPASPDVSRQVRLLAGMVDALMVCDLDWRCWYVSEGVERMLSRPGSDFLGKVLWEVTPEYVGGPIHRACLEAVARREPVDITSYNERRDAWYEQRISAIDDLILIATRDVSVREVSTRRRKQLLHVTEALARAVGPEEVAEVVVSMLMTHLPVQGVAVVVAEDVRSPQVLSASGFDAETLHQLVRDAPWPHEEKCPARHAAEDRPGSVTFLPLRAGTSLLGMLAVGRAHAAPFTDEQLNYLRTASASAAQALSRTLRSAAEHRAAITLQRSLLPEVRADIGTVTLAARYLPGDPGVEVGGDWFDAVAAGTGLYLLVGDVQGHDIEAAAIMGQLRSVVRAYAAEGIPPAGILRRADTYLDGLDCERLVTVLIVYLHCDGEIATIACAGHLPPKMLVRDARAWVCEDLPVSTGPPLGVPDARWTETTRLLPPEISILLFTDGLVETAAWGGIDRGLHDLYTALTGLPPEASMDDVLNAALGVIPAGLRGDDVAVLAAHIPRRADRGGRSARRAFPSHAMSVPLARNWLAGLLRGWDLLRAVDVAELVLSELISNAVRHSEEPVSVSLEVGPGGLVVEVFDRSHRLPVPRAAGAEDPGGRGLAVTAALADEWGVREELQGKAVWAHIGIG